MRNALYIPYVMHGYNAAGLAAVFSFNSLTQFSFTWDCGFMGIL